VLGSAWPEKVQDGSSAVRIAKEVRELIEAVAGDPSDRFDVEKGCIELRGSSPIQSAAEPGRLTYHKQH
jgi:putative component of toxin-antitoxin plasmid stabilization module